MKIITSSLILSNGFHQTHQTYINMSSNGSVSSPLNTETTESTLAGSDVDMDSDTATNGGYSDHESTPRPEPVNENEPVHIVPFLGRLEERPEHHDVCIVGAGPAGLMLG